MPGAAPSIAPPSNPLRAPTSYHALDEAILRTILYADVFNFPMTRREIHHFLIGVVADAPAVTVALETSRWLAERVDCAFEYYALRGRGAIIAERQRRTAASVALIPTAARYGGLLAGLPFVRMVALTGALAMHNAHDADDDIDYLIVTAPGRVWLARGLIVGIVKLAARRGAKLCPNYVLADTALAQKSHDLYLAHEVTQMIPIAGAGVYDRLRAENAWTADFLPNSAGPFHTVEGIANRRGMGALRKAGEITLSGPPGDALERWEQRRKLRKFAGEAAKQNSSAQLDEEHVKGHFNDYGYPTLRKYQARLVEYGLSALSAAPLDERP